MKSIKKKHARYALWILNYYDKIMFPMTSHVEVLSDCYVDPRLTQAAGKEVIIGDLLQPGARYLIVGDPGAGKTTLLKHLAVTRAREVLAGTTTCLPLRIPLRACTSDGIWEVANRETAALDLGADWLKGDILLLLDGLDEVMPEYRGNLLSQISQISDSCPSWQLVLTSRPSGLSPAPPAGFSFLHLASLGDLQIEYFLSRLGASPNVFAQFKSALETTGVWPLVKNPLILRLIWEVFKLTGTLPVVRADLYQTVCDFLLERWDAARAIRRQTILPVAGIHQILQTLAFWAYSRGFHTFPVGELYECLLSTSHGRYTQAKDTTDVVNLLLSSGILTEHGEGLVGFAHLSFLEFYAARHLVGSPDDLRFFLAGLDDKGREIALFVSGMLLDAGPLIESIVNRRDLILAAKCIREGRTSNEALIDYVIGELARELGPDIIRRLAKSPSEVRAPSTHASLQNLFLRSKNGNLSSLQKGKLFEEFVARLFGEVFEIVSCDTNTENGEIDLIVENKQTDPFWLEYGGDILVECKNWIDARPLEELGFFAHKVRRTRAKLGFFVSASGLTDDALQTSKYQASDLNAPLIVPITGQQILQMLETQERFDLFFKNAIRRIRHLRKYS